MITTTEEPLKRMNQTIKIQSHGCDPLYLNGVNTKILT